MAPDKVDIALIPLLALTSTDESIQQACKRASGFVYCISDLGVTGARASVSVRIKELARRVRDFTDLPIAIGFGISNAQHVADVSEYADAAVVGSALINHLSDGNTDGAAVRAGTYIQSLRPGTQRQVMAN